MIQTYIKSEKPCIILNDLIKINQERIICYQQSVDRATILDIDLKHLFEEIIAEGELFKEQLLYKINEIDNDYKDNIGISGMIHRAWLDLRINFTGNTRNAIINFCEYNEDVAQHAYRAALNVAAEMDYDIYTLIEEQQAILINTSASIKKCHRARHYSYPVMAYFN